tara:strand:+ start:257 stop:619 length:363 start_codon:yes stop_codon:yes gene_type:complete
MNKMRQEVWNREVADKVSDIFVEKFYNILMNPKSRHSFYMQELDGASKGNQESQDWVRAKNIDPSKYKGFDDENINAEKVQMALISWQMTQGLPIEETSNLKCKVVDAIMQKTEITNDSF